MGSTARGAHRARCGRAEPSVQESHGHREANSLGSPPARQTGGVTVWLMLAFTRERGNLDRGGGRVLGSGAPERGQRFVFALRSATLRTAPSIDDAVEFLDDGSEFFQSGIKPLRNSRGMFGQRPGARRVGMKLVHDDRAIPARPLDAA